MKLDYFEGFFPFCVPEKDESFASSTGAQTVYPAGFTLDEVMQIYWRAKDYYLTAAGSGTLGELSQTLAIDGNLPPRNARVQTRAFDLLGVTPPAGPGDLVCGRGLRQVVPGSGTITVTGGGSAAALFNLQVNLFYPEVFAPDPMVRYAGLWWPALSISCGVANTISTEDADLELAYDCTTLPSTESTTALGTFTFFGVEVPVFCTPLQPAEDGDPAETRSFSGALTVGAEWP